MTNQQNWYAQSEDSDQPGLEIMKLEFILKLKIKRSDWLLVDTCPQAANRYALFWVWDCTQVLLPRGQVIYPGWSVFTVPSVDN